MNKRGMILLLISLLMSSGVYADQYDFENDKSTKLSNLVSDSVLDKNIIIKRNFSNFNDFLDKVKAIGLSAKVKSLSADIISNVSVNFNGSNRDFITQTAWKFGYRTVILDDAVEFVAFNPRVNKPKSSLTAVIITKNLLTNNINVPIMSQPKWEMSSRDRTLRNVLSQWCRQANWQLSWKARGDFPITASWTINGTFEQAINQVLKSSQQTDMPLQALMFDANKVLEISSPK